MTITLKDFLKKYTAISNTFIDEYYKFYELCQKNEFGINIEIVLDFLEINQKKEFYDRIRNNYILDKDYIIVKSNSKKIKDTKNVNYFVSFDTFEKICMISNTKKASSVRDYFIILRKFIDYYKNHIANYIDKQVLLNPNKCIYIILVDKDKNIFKVGKTDDIRKRLKTYATGLAKHPDIKYIVLLDNPSIIEKCTKFLLEMQEYKKNHEVYKTSISVLKKTIHNCIDININKYDDKNNDAFIVFDDDAINDNKKIPKKASKKTSKKTSKKNSKKNSKNKSKKTSKKISKK